MPSDAPVSVIATVVGDAIITGGEAIRTVMEGQGELVLGEDMDEVPSAAEPALTVHTGAELYGFAKVCEHSPLLIVQVPALRPFAPWSAGGPPPSWAYRDGPEACAIRTSPVVKCPPCRTTCPCASLYPLVSFGMNVVAVLAKSERYTFPPVTSTNSVTVCPSEESIELVMMVNPAVIVA